MDVQVEKLSPVLMELRIQVPADTVSSAVDDAYDRLRKTARVRGFRRGKAPLKIIKQLYGAVVYADVAKKLMDSSLDSALKERAVQPLTNPAMDGAELKPREPFSFKARFEVRPDIEKVEWRGLEVTRPSVAVSEAMIDEEIEKLRLQHATLQPIEERPARRGDLCHLTLGFEIEGETRSEVVDTEVGEGKVMAAIDAALEGMRPGEHKPVEVAFPEGHHAPQFRGKTVSIRVGLEELKERLLPAVDDELAKDCEHDNLAALREATTALVRQRLEDKASEEVAKALVRTLCERNPVPVPPTLVQQQARQSEQELRQMAQLTGTALPPNFAEAVRGDAEMKVRAGLLMAEIAKEAELKVTAEDIEKGYQDLAQQGGKNVARVKAEYRERQDMLVGMILEDKVLTLMEKSAKITAGS